MHRLLLFGATSLGMTVVITEVPVAPELSTPPALAMNGPAVSRASLTNAPYQWHPGRGEGGIISVVVSTADERAIVMRDGVEVGWAPVRYSGNLAMPVAYVLRARDADGPHWLKLHYAGTGGSMEVSSEEAKRFDAPALFRQQLAGILTPGSVVIVTPQPLKAGSTGSSQTVIESDEKAP